MNALDVVQEIIQRCELWDARLTLVSHPTSSGWRQRHPAAEERIKDMAGELPARAPSGTLIRGDELFELSLNDLEAYRRQPDHVVSISSLLEGPTPRRHLALMDLQLVEFIPRGQLMAAVRKLCDRRGFRLLETDRHYHVYGCFLLQDAEWVDWNVRFQMPDALVDSSYVVQSLAWGCNLLRLTAGATLQTRVPELVRGDSDCHLGREAVAAVQLAQRRHRWQSRKSGQPVVYHLEEVARLAVEIQTECLGLGTIHLDEAATNDELYASGYLHDCIEDTNTDYDLVARTSGARVAQYVVEVTEDKRLPEEQRHAAYEAQLAEASFPARIVKLADLLSNLRGLTGREDPAWAARYLRDQVEPQLRLLRRDLERCSAYHEAEVVLEQSKRKLDLPERIGACTPAFRSIHSTDPGNEPRVESVMDQRRVR